MLKKMFMYLLTLVKCVFGRELLRLPELNNRLNGVHALNGVDYRFYFRKDEDEDAYMHLRSVMPFEFESHDFNLESNQGAFLLRYKRNFFVLRYKKDKSIVEITAFAAVGKKELVCPLDVDNIDNIYLSSGYAIVKMISCISLANGSYMNIEISFCRISIFVSYSTVLETIYRFSEEANYIGAPILKEKKKVRKYEHDAAVVTTKEC